MAFNYVRHHFPEVFNRSFSPIPNYLRRSNMPTNNSWRTARAAFVIYSCWPDTPDSGERYPHIGAFGVGAWSNTSHFYRPSNGLNYFRDHQRPGINARERTGFYFDLAVQAYNANNHRQAFYYLGASSHFLTDLAAPVHTGDQIGSTASTWSPSNPLLWLNVAEMAGIHVSFEDQVRNHVLLPFVNSHNGNIPVGVNFGGQTISRRSLSNLHPFDLAREVALISYEEYPNVWFNNANHTLAERIRIGNKTLPIAVNANVILLLRFMEEVGYPTALGTPGLVFSGTTVTGFITPPNFNGVVNISYGVTAIGAGAFQDNNFVADISLPSTVGRV